MAAPQCRPSSSAAADVTPDVRARARNRRAGTGWTWPVAHDAFARAAGPVLEERRAPVPYLGINEHRRGRPRWRRDEETGEYALLADRWHTCFYDLSGWQGMLGQAEGRTADDAAQVVAIDRIPSTASRNLLLRNLEHLSPDQFAKIIETLDADAAGQQFALARIAKEKLRAALNLRARVTGSTPCERQVRGRLFAFYDWCARHEDIPGGLDVTEPPDVRLT